MISAQDALLFIHPTAGVLGAFAALWVLVECINYAGANLGRIRAASITAALLMLLTWVTSGYWYVTYYAADKAIIKASSWSFAHALVMESKEHIFFITLVLALLLPIVAMSKSFIGSRSVRTLAATTAVLIVLSVLALEGMGAVISFAVRIGLMEAGL